MDSLAALRTPVHESVLRRLPSTPRSGGSAKTTPASPRSPAASLTRTPTTPSSLRTPRKSTMGTPSSASRTRRRTPQSDRFIPSRAAMDLDLSRYALCENQSANALADTAASDGGTPQTPLQKQHRNVLQNHLLSAQSGENSNSGTPRRVLSFAGAATGSSGTTAAERDDFSSPRARTPSSASSLSRGTARAQREIPSAPQRILDAPELVDDYYLNLLSWSSTNILAVALGQSVYLWNAASGTVEELTRCEEADNYITSVSWGEGNTVAVGNCYGDVTLYDGVSLQETRNMDGHTLRVGSLSWNGGNMVSSGSRDSSIINHDVRAPNHKVAVLRGHQQEVCGLRWSPDRTTLASGGNGNLLCLWDAAQSSLNQQPRARLTQHVAAVKALAWCPFQRNVLASGGGTADRTIKFWNAASGDLLNSIDTGSQVCSLLWSPREKELLSSHGFSQNQLCLWRYPTMTKLKELTGHTSRVLHMAASPDGSTVVSAAADETLRLWQVFGSAKKSKKSFHSSSKLMGGMMLR